MSEITFKHTCIQCGECAAVCPTHKITMAGDGPTVHDNRECLLCMHCTSVCPQKAIHFAHVPEYAEYPDTPEDDTLNLIMSRRSVRHFTEEAPHPDDIQWALDVAQYAPSGKNMHMTKYIVVHTKKECDALYHFVCDQAAASGLAPYLARQRDMGHHDSVTCGCSTIILGLAPDSITYGINEITANTDIDTQIALSHVELLLIKQELGTCRGGYLSAMVNGIPAVAEYLRIPEGYHVAGSLLVGYPDVSYRNIPYRPAADITWFNGYQPEYSEQTHICCSKNG